MMFKKEMIQLPPDMFKTDLHEVHSYLVCPVGIWVQLKVLLMVRVRWCLF